MGLAAKKKKKQWKREEQIRQLEQLDDSLALGIGDFSGFLDFLKNFLPILQKIIAFIMGLNPGAASQRQQRKLKKLVAAYKAKEQVASLEWDEDD